jgi:exopolyphosphatase / guanosine-5'-triphosphate,3'-diphosphate pyrophosphatase
MRGAASQETVLEDPEFSAGALRAGAPNGQESPHDRKDMQPSAAPQSGEPMTGADRPGVRPIHEVPARARPVDNAAEEKAAGSTQTARQGPSSLHGAASLDGQGVSKRKRRRRRGQRGDAASAGQRANVPAGADAHLNASSKAAPNARRGGDNLAAQNHPTGAATHDKPGPAGSAAPAPPERGANQAGARPDKPSENDTSVSAQRPAAKSRSKAKKRRLRAKKARARLNGAGDGDPSAAATGHPAAMREARLGQVGAEPGDAQLGPSGRTDEAGREGQAHHQHTTQDARGNAASHGRGNHAATMNGATNGSGNGAANGAANRTNPARAGAVPLPLYAALDLGTNNCRLLIATPTRPGQFRVVDAFSRIVRLGEGLVTSGRLSDAAMDRAVDALRVCAGKLADRSIRNARLIATEACRSADNGAAFLARVRRETGLELEIVDRETEARLAVSGCASLVDRDTDAVVLFDIGGGSSEIAVIDLPRNRSGRLANHIRAWTSLPVGVVTLSEQFGGRDVTRETFAAMVDAVDAMLKSFLSPQLPGMAGAAKAGRFHLLGTSGTVTTLAGVYLDLPRYDRRRVDGLWLSDSDVEAMLQKVLSWNFEERSANPCIGADRADLVLAGCAILEAIRRRWPSERMRVADRGLREGILTEMMAADGVWRRGRGRSPYGGRRSFDDAQPDTSKARHDR